MGKGEADAKYFFRKYLLLRTRCYSGTMSLIICICILRQLVGIKLREITQPNELICLLNQAANSPKCFDDIQRNIIQRTVI